MQFNKANRGIENYLLDFAVFVNYTSKLKKKKKKMTS